MPARPEWRDTAKEQHWRRLLRSWRRSGLTGRDFCSRNGLSEPSFYSWKREIARRDQEAVAKTVRAEKRLRGGRRPTFMQVTIAGGASDPSVIEVVVARGRLLRIRPGFDAATLRDLVRVLEEPAC